MRSANNGCGGVLPQGSHAGTFRPLLLPSGSDIPMGLVASNQVDVALQDVIGYCAMSREKYALVQALHQYFFRLVQNRFIQQMG